jgi:hypothetical protein
VATTEIVEPFAQGHQVCRLRLARRVHDQLIGE